MNLETRLEIYCMYCLQGFRSKDEQKAHSKACDKKSLQRYCKKCKLVIPRAEYVSHKQTLHQIFEKQCKKCKLIVSEVDFKEHKKNCLKDK